ncbi:MAG: DUF362 domain-containing protein [Candidatus Alcyoniella australis]|nr:DUF362 domain-containing protein [Candidatus Alcyoniella australis]
MNPLVQLEAQAEYDVEQIAAKIELILQRAQVDARGRKIFLKPSFVYPARPPKNRGVNTQPEFVAGVALALRRMGARTVWVGEDCLVGCSQSGFHAMGVLPLIRGIAQPLYLCDEPRCDVRIDNPIVESSFRMPQRMMDADLLISLPKIKVNMYTEVSLSVKNHMGLLLAPERLPNHHFHIHRKIADLYRTRPPDFVLADAIVAGQGQGPMHCDPAPLGLIVGSDCGPAADAISCLLMGYQPREIEHLRLLCELGLGPIDRNQIELLGDSLLNSHARALVRPRCDFADYDPSVRVFLGSGRACTQGCAGMVRGTLDPFAKHNDWRLLRGMNFIIGADVKDLPDDLDPQRTFVIGDCAVEHADRGRFISGCPIPPISLTYRLLSMGIVVPHSARVIDLAHGMLDSMLARRH